MASSVTSRGCAYDVYDVCSAFLSWRSLLVSVTKYLIFIIQYVQYVLIEFSKCVYVEQKVLNNRALDSIIVDLDRVLDVVSRCPVVVVRKLYGARRLNVTKFQLTTRFSDIYF